MGENLLRNGGFEEGWGAEESHRVLRVTPGGSELVERGNIFTPPGWTTWFYHVPGKWDQPEVRDAWKHHDPRRVCEGDKAQLLFTVYRRHLAGFYQEVEVPEAGVYRLTAMAHAWSNHDGVGCEHPDDPAWSEGVGTVVTGFPFEAAMVDTGDAQMDAMGNVRVQIGLGAAAVTARPFAERILWSSALCVYNGYTLPPLEVEFDVPGRVVLRVWLRSQTMWAFKHNDVCWDDVCLSKVEGPPPPPPPPQGGRGAPRLQYARRYVLLPPDVTREKAHEVLEEEFEERRTIGFSADDGGIGDLDERTVELVDPEGWPATEDYPAGEVGLRAFYEDHYPGVTVVTQGEPPGDAILLGQRDPRWASAPMGDDGCRATIGQSGCFITCLAMAQRFYGIMAGATPLGVDLSLYPDGYAGCHVAWRARPDVLRDRLGLEVFEGSAVVAMEHIGAGGCAMAEVARGEAQHFVLVTRDDDVCLVRDPWERSSTWEVTAELVARAESWRVVSKVDGGLPQRRTRGHVGLHLQTMVAGALDFVRDVRPAVVKVFGLHDVVAVKLACADTAVVFRQWVPNQGEYGPWGDVEAGAQRYVETFRDGLRHLCGELGRVEPGLAHPYLYVESLNEEYGSGTLEKNTAMRDWDLAFIEEVERLGLPVKPVVFCAAVGNPPEAEYEGVVLPLARRCAEVGGLMGYHPYWWANREVSGLQSWWPWHAGRWAEMDKVFVANGVHVRWFGGESGAVASVAGHHLNPVAGWRHEDCYGGDLMRFLDDVMDFDANVLGWNEAHGDRFLGMVLFTSGDGVGWEEFQFRAEEARALGDRLVARYA